LIRSLFGFILGELAFQLVSVILQGLKMLKVLKDLGLALLNATLILLALCLFLALMVVNTADDVASNFARNLIAVEPLRADFQATTDALASLRQDVAQLTTRSGEAQSAALLGISTRLEGVEADVAAARKAISDLSESPYRLVDHAIETAADSLAQKARNIRGCVPQES
jgi:hypothetical protein